jgi:hypothetical protein
LTDDEAKPNAKRGLEEVAAEQDKVMGARIEAGTSSQQPPNQTVRFPKLDHLVSTVSGQKQMSRTTMPRTAPAPRWCPSDSHTARGGGSNK